LGNSGTNETSAGDARGYSIKVTFASHINVKAQNMAVHTNSINTVGNAFESASVVFFDKSGTNYGSATYDGFYGSGSTGATTNNSCTAPAPGTPWAVSGPGVYTIGGFIYTVYLEDVAASSAPGANTTTSTSFSSTLKGVTITASLLPVELNNFQVQNTRDNKVNLTWETLSESNNDFFRIERSRDGFNFTDIGTVAGHNNSDITQSYQYNDPTVLNGTYYYRLCQVDFDGQQTYSEVKSIEINKESSYQVFPTVATHQVTITTSSNVPHSTFEVIDLFGRSLKRGTLMNNEAISLDINDLPEGAYFIRLSNGFKSEVFTISKR